MIFVSSGNAEGAVNMHPDTFAIANGAFRKAGKIEEVRLSDNIRVITKDAFLGLDSLTSIYISSSVESIEPKALICSGSLSQFRLEFESQDGWYYIDELGEEESFEPYMLSLGDKIFEYEWRHVPTQADDYV